MKRKRLIFLALGCWLLSLSPVLALDFYWDWVLTSPFPLTNRSPNYAYGVVDRTTGRLLVDIDWSGADFSGVEVSTATNLNLSSVGGTATVQTNGILTVYDLSPKSTNSTSFPSGSTNATGALNLAPTNVIHTIIDSGGTGGGEMTSESITNLLLSILSYQQYNSNRLNSIESAQTNGTQYVNAGLTNANEPNVRGWPVLVAMATVTNYLGTDLVANSSLNTNGLIFDGFTNAVILSVSYLCSSNQTTVESPSLLLTTNALTWVNPPAAAAVSLAEIPYILESYGFGTNTMDTAEAVNFRTFGNVSQCTVNGKNAITPPGITRLYGYLKTRAGITNIANDYIRIRYQNSY